MKLGDYTFYWPPNKYTVPKPDKFNSHVLTYSSVAFFSWGVDIVGKVIDLEWKWMSYEQFRQLQKLLEDDEQKTWDPEAPDRIWYKNAVNHPFVTGKIITGLTSSATGTISGVDTIHNNLILTNPGAFQEGEDFRDNSSPQKTGTITVIEIIPAYTVELLSLDGAYFEDMQNNFIWREDVSMSLLIMA